MPSMRRILAAVDFSDWTPAVIAAATSLGRAFRVPVDLVHVVPLRESETRAAQAQLEALPAQGVERRLVLRALAAELGVVDAAREGGADLVVLGTHGRTGLDHVRLGSVAERVVERSPVSVLTIRRAGQPSGAPSQGEAMLEIRSILCPVDFSEHSRGALEAAADIARRFDARLSLLHVIEPVLYPVAYGLPPVSSVDYESVARESAEKTLAQLAAGLSGLKPATRVDSGAASQRICELAKSEGHDLIVVATHGYTGLKHVFMGSTAERVVRHASCAVLVVKSH
jgi:nucleotide-binding universal stress UspA family protein